MSTLRAKLIRLASKHPELRSEILPLLKVGNTFPKATRRKASPAYREKVLQWVFQDATEKLGANGVPKKMITNFVHTISMVLRSKDFLSGKFKNFERQTDIQNWIKGQTKIQGLTSFLGTENYPELLEKFIQDYGQASNTYKDEIESILSKMNDKQKAMVWFMGDTLHNPYKSANKLEEYLSTASLDTYKKYLPIFRKVIKMKTL